MEVRKICLLICHHGGTAVTKGVQDDNRDGVFGGKDCNLSEINAEGCI